MWLDTLIQFKKDSGKTILQISQESGVPLGTLNKLFAGQTKDPKLQTVSSIVHALGYTLDDLFPVSNTTAPTTTNIQKVTTSMEAMNDEGQERVVDYADDLVQSGKYIKNSSV